jgi:adenine-specific DNA-methyltransferase
MSRDYSDLSKEQLIALLERRDRERRLGLVWEREALEGDRAVNPDFIVLDQDPALSAPGPNGAHNLIIEGDNYDALRALRMTHKGRVKCIYIDPPYNTGTKDWVYNDHYVAKEDRYRHSLWLEFMHQRLTLARDLLREDGVLMVSINDKNDALLKLLVQKSTELDFVGSFVWRTKDTANDQGYNFSAVHEYVHVFGKPHFKFLGLELGSNKYKNPDQDPRGPYSSDPLTKAHTYHDRPNTYYPIQDPRTGWWFPCAPDWVWRYASRNRLRVGQKLRTQTIEDLIKDERVIFPRSDCVIFAEKHELISAIENDEGPVDGNGNQLLRLDLPDLDFWVGKKIGLGRPSVKKFWNEKTSKTKPVSSIFASKTKRSADNELAAEKQGRAGSDLYQLMGRTAFNYPKPLGLLSGLLKVATVPGDIILDFFAGSGTTAHAAMALDTEAGDTEARLAPGAGRQWIMVSSTEATAAEPDKNLARDVLRERIVRAGAKLAHAPAFAYLRTRRVAREDMSFDIDAPEIWRLILLRHAMALVAYAGGDGGWQEASSANTRLFYLDSVSEAACAAIDQALAEEASGAGRDIIVYCWTAGLLRNRFEGRVQLNHLLDDLVKGFFE